MVQVIRCHRLNMKTSIINGSKVSRLSVAIQDDVANDPDLAGISRLTENHVALWQAIRSRTASGDSCTRTLVRDDMKAMGFDVSKKFARWLDKLEKDGLIAFDGEHITPLPHRNKVGD